MENEYIAGIVDFLDNCPQRNIYVPFSRGSMYLRKGSRYLANHTVAALDFGNFSLDDDLTNIEGAMVILQFVQAAEKVCQERRLVFYVESVINEVLAAFFRRRKYKEIGTPMCPCFVKYPSKTKKF